MEIISTVSVLHERLESESNVAFVPTMGNLHEGHLALVRLAKQHAKCVVVSIFVNPLQFGPNEDLDKYPRTLADDCAKLREAGVDVLFTPTEAVLFPVPQQVTVEPPPVANELCGASRPGHFRGVATIVLKLLNIVQPKVAIFGKKDYQQLHVIRTMVKQLNVPVDVVGGETERASDGLALSSRNGYLQPDERVTAIRLVKNLQQIKQALLAGECGYDAMEALAVADLEANGWRVDYVAIRAQQTLGTPQSGDKALVVLAAAWLGQTRLIDNLEVLVPD